MTDPALMQAEYRRRIVALYRMIGANAALCRGCQRTIYWVTSVAGKRVPYTEDGNNHFIDCPSANHFRRAPGKASPKE